MWRIEMKYKKGQTVVHQSHGVGEITGIESRNFSGGIEQDFYIVTIMDNGCPKRIFVPIDGEDRLRPLITRFEVEGIYKELSTPINYDYSKSWNTRYREHLDKIQSGNLSDCIAVLKDLNHLKKDKTLSFGERKLFECALYRVSSELMEVEDLDQEDVEKKILDKLG